MLVALALPVCVVLVGQQNWTLALSALLLLRILSVGTVLLVLSSPLNNLQKRAWTFLVLLMPAVFLPLVFACWRFGSEDGIVIESSACVQFFNSGEEGIADIINHLKICKHHAYLEFFIVSRGRLWEQLLAELEAAALRGVDVRLIYGNRLTNRHIQRSNRRRLELAGAVVLPSRAGGLEGKILGYTNHRKLVAIDNVGYLGGVNVADQYANIAQNSPYYKDSLVKIHGTTVRDFFLLLNFPQLVGKAGEGAGVEKSFGEGMGVEKSLAGEITPPVPYKIYSCTPQNGVARRLVLELINAATHTLTITTPYLVVDSQLLGALRSAINRNVRVTIVLPSVPDKPLAHRLSLHYAEKLRKLGADVLQFSNGYLHQKMILSDTTLLLGSINLDSRSLSMQYESALLLPPSPSASNTLTVQIPLPKTHKLIASKPSLLLPLLLLAAPLV